MKLSKTFWLIFWLVTGLIIGTLLYRVAAQVPLLSWLALAEHIRFSPSADLSILTFSLDLEFRLSLAQVVGVLIGMLCHRQFTA